MFLIFSVQLTQNIIGKHLRLILNLLNLLGIDLAVLYVHHGRDLPSCSLVLSKDRDILPAVSHYRYYIRFVRAMYEEHIDLCIFIVSTP